MVRSKAGLFKSPLLVIVGETASGKSSLALGLAQKLNGEIICADSWTVYKDFNVGTAKPNEEERRLVPHHLLDVAHPEEGFSAPQFQRLAWQAIDDISRRGKLPIMVGGTGLYIDSVLYDYSFLPSSNELQRQRLNDRSLDELLDKADAMGLDTSFIDRRNKRRVIRLIENKGQLPSRSHLRENTLVIGLRLERDELRQRVTHRVDAMLAAGLEREVRQLAKRFGWGIEPMKGIGYKEWRGYIAGNYGLEEVKAKISKNTMDLAKRQRTWFKRNKCIQWIDNREQIDNIVELSTTKLNT